MQIRSSATAFLLSQQTAEGEENEFKGCMEVSEMRRKEIEGTLKPEPLLIENPGRFVLFPIQDNEVGCGASRVWCAEENKPLVDSCVHNFCSILRVAAPCALGHSHTGEEHCWFWQAAACGGPDFFKSRFLSHHVQTLPAWF